MSLEGTTQLQICVVDQDGHERMIDWQEGQSLMEAIRDNDLPIMASCGGSRSCATCHVHVDAKWFDAFGPRQPEELELLEQEPTFRADASRLSCQLAFSPDLGGLRVHLAAKGF